MPLGYAEYTAEANEDIRPIAICNILNASLAYINYIQ